MCNQRRLDLCEEIYSSSCENIIIFVPAKKNLASVKTQQVLDYFYQFSKLKEMFISFKVSELWTEKIRSAMKINNRTTSFPPSLNA